MKAMKYYICFILLTLSSRIYSQIPDTIWTKTFGGSLADVGNSVKQTNDGGFIVAGTTSSFGAGGQDIYLIKTNENGDTLWTKTFGGTGNDRASTVQQTNDDGYAIFGTTNSYGNGGDDFLLWKTDSLGITEWFETYGTGLNETEVEGQQTFDGGYILTGYFYNQSYRTWTIKTDNSGNEIWERTIDFTSSNYYAYSMTQTTDSGYVICGTWFYWYSGSYRYNYYLIKYSSIGDLVFSKYYEFTGRDVGTNVRETNDGNLILGGVTENLTENQRTRLVKVSSFGNIIWNKIVMGSRKPVYPTSLEVTQDNGFIFSLAATGGLSSIDFQIIKTDEIGTLTWEHTIGGNAYDSPYSVYPTQDEGFIVTGQTNSFGAGDFDVWLLKFKYNTPDVQIQFFPTVDTAWVFGGCTGPDLITHNLVSTPVRDSIIIEPGGNSNFFYYDSLGNIVQVDKYYFIVEDSLNQYEYELWFHPKSWPPFNPVQITFDSVFSFQQNLFDIQLLVKLNGNPIDSLSQLFKAEWGLGVEETGEIPQAFSLSQNYPNPFNPSTTIKFGIADFGFVSLKIYDVLGNEIATLVNEEKQPGTYEITWFAENLPSGIYFYRLQTGSFIETKKMVLMK